MPNFVTRELANLTRRLMHEPAVSRRAYVENAESLYWDIDPAQNYPIDFVWFRLTGRREEGRSAVAVTLTGQAVRRDLPRIVEELSDSLAEPLSAFAHRPIGQRELAERLNVSVKTVGRYRERGLIGRWAVAPTGRRRKRLVFTEESVRRFLEHRSEDAGRAASFSRIDDDTRHEMVIRARRIAARVDTTPFAVARHLAKKYGRSVEAVRLMLVAHDRRDPRTAIFPDHTPPLTDFQQRLIHRAYHRGISVARLAEHLGKARNAIYRALNKRRAAAIRQLRIPFVYHFTFELPDAEHVILDSALADDGPAMAKADAVKQRRGDRAADPLAAYFDDLADEAPLSAEAERPLFVRYNYLKYRADQLRRTLDPYQPRSGDLDRIETWLRRAVIVKQRIVRASLRLVVATARRHLSGPSRGSADAIGELIAEGNLVLMQAIDTFDPGRENRFSTYLTWALMRRFATAEGREKVEAAGRVSHEYWPAALNPAAATTDQADRVVHALTSLMRQLDERERMIVSHHFGLAAREGEAAPKARTLAQIGKQLGITAERARQIERRAIRKLRQMARELGIEGVDPDPLGRP